MHSNTKLWFKRSTCRDSDLQLNCFHPLRELYGICSNFWSGRTQRNNNILSQINQEGVCCECILIILYLTPTHVPRASYMFTSCICLGKKCNYKGKYIFLEAVNLKSVKKTSLRRQHCPQSTVLCFYCCQIWVFSIPGVLLFMYKHLAGKILFIL